MNTIAEGELPWWNARVTKNWFSVANVGIEFITMTSTKLDRFIVFIQSLRIKMNRVKNKLKVDFVKKTIFEQK